MSPQEKRLNNLVRQIEGRCHHFTGAHEEICKAGVSYTELAGPNEGMGLRLPCLNPQVFAKRREELGYKLADCPKLQRTSHNEAVAEAQEIIAHSANTTLVMIAAHADAKQKGFKKGAGGIGSMPCPNNCGGTLRYSVASYNGHMHAKCDTASCVSWME